MEQWKSFNEEVERYRRTLLSLARKCDWDAFKVQAGRLFDYVESIEMTEVERRFMRIFKIIMVILFIVLAFVWTMNPEMFPELARHKKGIVLMALAGGCFELYYYLSFRMFMEQKTKCYNKRRERFIRNIEQDFRACLVAAAA